MIQRVQKPQYLFLQHLLHIAAIVAYGHRNPKAGVMTERHNQRHKTLIYFWFSRETGYKTPQD